MKAARFSDAPKAFILKAGRRWHAGDRPQHQSLGLVATPLPATWSMLLAVLIGFGLWTAKDRARQSGTA